MAIGVALSGGGHRAGLFGLGALLYLADAGKNEDIVAISSVSGGSLTNGFVAQATDYRVISGGEFRQSVRPLAKRLARTGTLFPPSALTTVYLLSVLLAVASLVGVWFLPWPVGARVGAFAVALVLLAWLVGLRGLVCSRAFAKTLYSPRGRPTRLSKVSGSLDHVLCAADLHAGEHVYFSRDFVCSYRLGWGTPGDLPLHVAVQCSAALPGAFPPRWLRTSRHRFADTRSEAAGSTRMALVDGGVYDNMADQWFIGLADRRTRWPEHTKNLRDPDEVVIVNASAGLEWSGVWRMRLPLVGELLALLRDKTVLYDNGNAVRRELAVERFRDRAPAGALVHIARSPLWVPDHFVNSHDPQVADRAREVIDLLEPERADWNKVTALSAHVPTTLWGFRGRTGAAVIRHGYALAMANLRVILGYPVHEVPPIEFFEDLVG